MLKLLNLKALETNFDFVEQTCQPDVSRCFSSVSHLFTVNVYTMRSPPRRINIVLQCILPVPRMYHRFSSQTYQGEA